MFNLDRIIGSAALLALTLTLGPALAAEKGENAQSPGKKADEANADKAEQTGKKDAARPPLKSDKQKLSYSIGVTIATGLRRDGLDVAPNLVAAGVRDMLAGREPQLSQEQVRTALMQLQQRMQEERAQQQQQQQAGQQNGNGNNPGNTPAGESLRNAALHGSADSVKKAIQNGDDVNATGRQGQTPLMLAAYNGHAEIIKLLLENDAKVRAVDANGRTALMYASTGAFPETVKLLLNHEPMLDRTDNGEGFTALMFAAAEGNTEVARHLLEAGADPTVTDADGETALDFATTNGHTETAKLLKKHIEQQK